MRAQAQTVLRATPDLIAHWVAAYQAGATLKVLSRQSGLSNVTVLRHLRSAGLVLRPRGRAREARA